MIDGFLEGLDKKVLVRGMRNACAEIDSPIMDDVFTDKPRPPSVWRAGSAPAKVRR